jgi:drug/metabolite transporter (DMT)-like permease
MDRMGPLLCLLSAAGFGAMAIFGKLAYDAGVEVGDLLLVRFALAAALLLAVAAATGALNSLPRRSVLAGLGMGAIGYATQSGLFFAALERMDASLLALILYVYPALVLIGAVALGRERASVRRVTALLIALAGTALVLVGAASGSLDALGAVQLVGGALVLGAVLVMQWPATAGRTWPSTADHAPASAITSPCLNSPPWPSAPLVRTAEIHCLDEGSP